MQTRYWSCTLFMFRSTRLRLCMRQLLQSGYSHDHAHLAAVHRHARPANPAYLLNPALLQEGVRLELRVRRPVQRGRGQAHVGLDAVHQLGQPTKAHLRAHVAVRLG